MVVGKIRRAGRSKGVRSLVLNPLNKARVTQLTAIGQRVVPAIDPDDDYRDGSKPNLDTKSVFACPRCV